MKVLIVGAGTMGAGIAQVFAQSGVVEQVYLTDLTAVLAENGKKKIEKGLSRLVAKERITAETADHILSKIKIGIPSEYSDPDFVIEAAVENMEIKKQMFRDLDRQIQDNAIFASNTSSLSITELGSGLKHPLIGMHFFNPAPVMKLVEVISGLNTPEAVVSSVIELAEQLGKTPVRVEEAPGFVVNRILIPMINEAVCVLAEGTASAEDIDTAMKLGANHPLGPLALADLIGLDVVLAIMEVLHRETGDSKYRPAPLLRKMVRAGKMGRKTGEGFFQYQ